MPITSRSSSRGVVRIVIIEQDGDELVPIAHGTGFAVTPEMIVTNAHVVQEAREAAAISAGSAMADGAQSRANSVRRAARRRSICVAFTACGVLKASDGKRGRGEPG